MCWKAFESKKTNGAELTNSAPSVVLGEGIAREPSLRARFTYGASIDFNQAYRRRCLRNVILALIAAFYARERGYESPMSHRRGAHYLLISHPARHLWIAPEVAGEAC